MLKGSGLFDGISERDLGALFSCLAPKSAKYGKKSIFPQGGGAVALRELYGIHMFYNTVFTLYF